MLESLKRLIGVSGSEKTHIAENALLIDVRSESEYKVAHLEGAMHLPLEKLASHCNELPKDRQLVLYCRSGNRSSHARKILEEHGFHHVVDAGGLQTAETMLLAAGRDAHWIREAQDAPAETIPEHRSGLKIVLPTDFSVQADFAHIMAKKLQGYFDVEMHLLHVIEVPETVTLDDHGKILTCGEIDVEFLERQKGLAEAKLKEYTQESLSIHGHIVFGKLNDEVNRFASEKQCDLILMGTKGAWGIKEKLTGSNTQQIARRASLPVMSLMCDRSDLVFNDLLYVHDFKNEAECPPLLRRFLIAFEAQYHQLHITSNTSDDQVLLDEMTKFAISQDIGKFQNHIEVAGSVEEGVNQFLANQNADIVFIGTHGKGGIFHESAAENLVKHLFKPIVLFHF
jgi:rhodanese-related sulfurtransferase/nucleotide-binding universal stress UspA family protein